MAAGDLTPAQELFAQHVADGKRQAVAYRIAFPKAKAWQPSTVHEQASRLANDDKVAARIKELQAQHAERLAVTKDKVINEIARLALFDPRNLFDEKGVPRPIEELDGDTAAVIAGIEVLETFEGTGQDRVFVGYTKKYKIADKNAALEKLAKHLGLYEQDNKQRGTVIVSELTDAQRASRLALILQQGKPDDGAA